MTLESRIAGYYYYRIIEADSPVSREFTLNQDRGLFIESYEPMPFYWGYNYIHFAHSHAPTLGVPYEPPGCGDDCY